MVAYAVLRESVLRKNTILVAHVLLPVIYIACIPLHIPVGVAVFALGGIALPLVLTNGIWGNDISSGRIRMLALTPVGVERIYLWRLAGVLSQGVVHLLAAACVQVLGNTMDAGHDGPWFVWTLATFFLFCAMASFSSALSVVVRGEHNAPLIVLILVLLVFGHESLARESPSALIRVSKGALMYASWLFPPITGLMRACYQGRSVLDVAGLCLVACAQACVYGTIGAAILHAAEHRPQGPGETC